MLAAAGSDRLRAVAAGAPVSRDVVRRFVAGETTEDAVQATRHLLASGLLATIDHLGEDTTDASQAEAIRIAYVTLLGRLADEGLTSGAEVSVKLSAIGQALPGDGEKIALEHARQICGAAEAAGTTVTLDMEDHTTTDSTLGILTDLRRDFPATGAVLQAYLHRTEGDCADLAYAGSRVRLCKGAYHEPESVAYQDTSEVDRSYVRCLRMLMAGPGTRWWPATTRGWSRSRVRWLCATSGRRAATSTRCCTASGPTSRPGWPSRARRCASTCRTATSGGATWCAGWPRSRRT